MKNMPINHEKRLDKDHFRRKIQLSVKEILDKKNLKHKIYSPKPIVAKEEIIFHTKEKIITIITMFRPSRIEWIQDKDRLAVEMVIITINNKVIRLNQLRKLHWGRAQKKKSIKLHQTVSNKIITTIKIINNKQKMKSR